MVSRSLLQSTIQETFCVRAAWSKKHKGWLAVMMDRDPMTGSGPVTVLTTAVFETQEEILPWAEKMAIEQPWVKRQ